MVRNTTPPKHRTPRSTMGTLCCRMVRPIVVERTDPTFMAASSMATEGPFTGLEPVSSPLSARTWPVFHGTLASLREQLPAAFPVIVRSAELGREALGACHRTADRFVIRLAANLKEHEAADVLIHEWAHALAWTHSLDKLVSAPDTDQSLVDAASHDAAWGCAFAEIWRLFVTRILPDLRMKQLAVRRK